LNNFPLNVKGTRAFLFYALISWIAMGAPLHASGPVILLIGPPGAGATTQAQILKKDRGMAIISADDLIARNQSEFQRFKNPSIQGVDPHLDPVLNRLVEEALQAADLSKGVVLDGYPAAKTQGDYVASLREKLGLPRALVIHLLVPDDVVRKRLRN
jgi:adenylate kinase family enzyme